MADRLKEALDVQWHTFLDHLNQTYEDAYESVQRAAPRLGEVESIDLVEVRWPVNEAIHIGLGATIRQSRESDES